MTFRGGISLLKDILIITIFFVLVIFILSASGIYFYDIAILRNKKRFPHKESDLPTGAYEQTWAVGKAWIRKQQCEEIKIKSWDGLVLKADYLSAVNYNNITVILIHGYTGLGHAMGCFAQYYHEEHDFNVIMPDCRGHGESEGAYIGFGWQDRKDIMEWISYILNKHGAASQIILHGVSMGGGAVLMTSGEKLPVNVKFIISDCAYTSASDIITYQMGRVLKLPKFPLIYIISLICKLRAGYYLGEASALTQVSKSKIPILFIHGEADKFVPLEMVNFLYKAAQCEKELFIVEDAGHGEAYWKDMQGYKNQVENFIDKYIVK
jgi:uncharacterized protein